jgi:small subunit ribosomal protein S6
LRYIIFLASVKPEARDQKEVHETMNKYELALVVNAKIEDEARNAVVESVKDMVVKAGGQNIEVVDGGRRKLAYEIQKMSEGCYYFIQFEAEPTAPADIEQRIRIKENVLRFLCVRQDEE